MNTKPRIFIGSSIESLIVAEAIKANFEFENVEARIWNEDLFTPDDFTLNKLIQFTKSFDIAIFVWASDDKVEIENRNITKKQPRDNVILEAGMFYASLGKDRVFLFAPQEDTPKIPSDLLGLTPIRYKLPSDGNYKSELNYGVSKIKKIIKEIGVLNRDEIDNLPYQIFGSLDRAKNSIVQHCINSTEIKILSNKGLEFFGSDSSIVSLADILKYKKLRQIKVLLLSPKSRWINRGLMALRKYESLDDFRNELTATHKILEIGMKKIITDTKIEGSGIKYHLGEPYFRFIMTDNDVFVSTYAENPSTQVRDLPVYHFKNSFGSLYGSLKKHFNDYWKNNAEVGATISEFIDVEVSAGGLVYCKVEGRTYILLIQREDGSWVLPKGHKKRNEKNLEITVLREITEETSISASQLEIIKKIDSYSFDETADKIGINKLNHFYLVVCNNSSLPLLTTDPDHILAKWYDINDEIPFLFYNYQKIIISETIKNEFDINIKINPK